VQQAQPERQELMAQSAQRVPRERLVRREPMEPLVPQALLVPMVQSVQRV